jgi:hypothetical protein
VGNCEEFFRGYNDHIPRFDPQLINNLQLADFQMMSQVFGFIGITVPDMRRELISYLKHYWACFWGLNINQIFVKMVQALAMQPAPRPPKINWVAAYGGLLKEKPGFGREQKWHETYQVPYPIHDSQDPPILPPDDVEELQVGK